MSEFVGIDGEKRKVTSKDWDVGEAAGDQQLPVEFHPRKPDLLVHAIAEAMSDAVWERARNASHRPNMVDLWWLDANARYSLAEAAAKAAREMLGDCPD